MSPTEKQALSPANAPHTGPCEFALVRTRPPIRARYRSRSAAPAPESGPINNQGCAPPASGVLPTPPGARLTPPGARPTPPGARPTLPGARQPPHPASDQYWPLAGSVSLSRGQLELVYCVATTAQRRVGRWRAIHALHRVQRAGTTADPGLVTWRARRKAALSWRPSRWLLSFWPRWSFGAVFF